MNALTQAHEIANSQPIWSIEQVRVKAKSARDWEDEYQARVQEFPLEGRSPAEQSYVDHALSQYQQAMRDYRAEILKDPNWHPDNCYPHPMDYR